MRTFTTETTVYEFDELSEDAKQHAIEQWIENDDMPFLYEYMMEELERLFAKYKITSDNAAIRYSLSYSQGDGASFTGDIEWRGTWSARVVTNGYGNYYSHYNTVNIDTDEVRSIKTDKPAPQATIDKLAGIIQDIGIELEKSGYAYIDDCHSDEAVADTLRANEYEFTAEGDMA